MSFQLNQQNVGGSANDNTGDFLRNAHIMQNVNWDKVENLGLMAVALMSFDPYVLAAYENPLVLGDYPYRPPSGTHLFGVYKNGVSGEITHWSMDSSGNVYWLDPIPSSETATSQGQTVFTFTRPISARQPVFIDGARATLGTYTVDEVNKTVTFDTGLNQNAVVTIG